MKQRWQSVAAQIQRTTTARGRAASGCFSIEGTRLHERALRANKVPTAVLVAQAVWQNPPPREAAVLEQLTAANIPCQAIPDEAMARLTQGRQLGGLLGLLPLPPALRLPDALVDRTSPTLLAAVNVVDPGNVGGLIRTAHALGADLFIAAGSSEPYHPRAVRTSMGSLFKLPIITTSAQDLLAALKSMGIESIGAVAAGGEPLPHFQPSQQGTAVFMGGEYWGLPEKLLNQLDRRVTIPMAAGIDSFSINAAAAIVLYELQRPNK